MKKRVSGTRREERRGEEKEAKKEKQRWGGGHRQNKSTQQVTDGKCSQNPTIKKIVSLPTADLHRPLQPSIPPWYTQGHHLLLHPALAILPNRSRKEFKKHSPLSPRTPAPREPTSLPLRPSAFGSSSTLTAPQPLRGLVSTPHPPPLQPGSTAPPPALARSLPALPRTSHVPQQVFSARVQGKKENGPSAW